MKTLNLIKKHWLGVLGFVVLFIYLSSTFQLINYPNLLFIILILAISPVAIVGVVAIGNELLEHRKSFEAQLGKYFGILAFGIFEIMLCVQLGTRAYFKEHMLGEAQQEVSQEVAKAIYQGVNSVQFTIDIAFDVFYCLLIVLYSYEMFRNKNYGKPIGVFGVLVGLGLLGFNIWTFPYPPAEAGLIDLGPVTAIWWIWAIIGTTRQEKKSTVKS